MRKGEREKQTNNNRKDRISDVFKHLTPSIRD